MTFLLLMLSFGVSTGASTETRIPHRVHLQHPGIGRTNKLDCTLVQWRGANGRPDEFSMDVDSASCGDRQCKNVQVRLYWDELGFYDRFELAPGSALEKAEGKPFSKSDYARLNQVLANPDSVLARVDLSAIVQYRQSTSEVDGVSGATVSLDSSQYVQGAIWTCYSLWHWANGEVRARIRELTAAGCDNAALRNYLQNGNRAGKVFALQQLTRRRAYDPKTLNAVVDLAAEVDLGLAKLLVEYVEQAEPGIYHAALERLLPAGKKDLRLLCLHALWQSKRAAPPGYYDRLIQWAISLDSFQEMDLALRLINSKNAVSPNIVQALLPLLESHNVIVARRAYWFLLEQRLSKKQCKKLEAFAQKNAPFLSGTIP